MARPSHYVCLQTDVAIPVGKVHNSLIHLGGVHVAMGDQHGQIGDQFAQFSKRGFEVFNAWDHAKLWPARRCSRMSAVLTDALYRMGQFSAHRTPLAGGVESRVVAAVILKPDWTRVAVSSVPSLPHHDTAGDRRNAIIKLMHYQCFGGLDNASSAAGRARSAFREAEAANRIDGAIANHADQDAVGDNLDLAPPSICTMLLTRRGHSSLLWVGRLRPR